jgi:hypothetical protein
VNVVDIIIGLISLLGLCGGVFSAWKAYGALTQKVTDQSVETDELKKVLEKLGTRLDKAEEAAAQTNRLADAVEHMGIRFTDQIKNLVETMRLKDEHIREQLADIKNYLNRTKE